MPTRIRDNDKNDSVWEELKVKVKRKEKFMIVLKNALNQLYLIITTSNPNAFLSSPTTPSVFQYFYFTNNFIIN